jgi:hypothetical protein
MKVKYYKYLTGYLRITLLLVLAAIFAFTAIPVSAHAPQGAGETPDVEIAPIQIYDSEGNLLEISINDVAAIHGDLCVCVAGAYRVTQAAIDVLYGDDELPAQGDLTLVYHHPGTGHKQVFEHILTPDCVFYEKTGNPQHMTVDHWVYKFTRIDTGEYLKPVLTKALSRKISSNCVTSPKALRRGGMKIRLPRRESSFAAAYTETLNNLLTLPVWELYAGGRAEEPAPVGAIIFSGVLIVLMVLGFIYSARGKKR